MGQYWVGVSVFLGRRPSPSSRVPMEFDGQYTLVADGTQRNAFTREVHGDHAAVSDRSQQDDGRDGLQHDEPINREGTPEAKFSNADYYGSWSTPLLREIDGRTEFDRQFSLPSLLVRSRHRQGTVDQHRHQCTGLHVTAILASSFLSVG